MKLNDTQEFVKVLAIAIIAGFAGISMLQKLSDNLLQKVEAVNQEVKTLKLHERTNEFIRTANFYFDNNQYEEAIIDYDHALKIDPKNTNALIAKGVTLKRLGRVDSAFDVVENILKIYPDNQKALYNRACYGNLLKHNRTEVLNDLKKTCALSSEFKQFALNDPDFEDLHDDKEFKKITEN